MITRLITPAVVASAMVSCATDSGNQYDTANPYGAADPSTASNNAYQQPVNPVYDSPAAYGDTATAAPPAGMPAAPPIIEPSYASEPTPAPPANPNAPATIHTVVKGDTLSGLSSKYNVPIESIKAANNMTNDIVVLGRKMAIPAR